MRKIKCPYCGYETSAVKVNKNAICRGIFIKCKNKDCKKTFEIKIKST